MRNGLMARQSQHKTLCIAGNVLLIRTLLLRMPVICNMGISPVLMKFLKGKNRLPILGVKAIDDHTLEVTLSEPVPYFYKLLVHPSTSPVPKAAIEKFGEKWTQPGNIVTNGAYTLKDWVVNERIVLERSPTYWNNAKTVINQVTDLPIASEVTDVNRYRSGEIDMTITTCRSNCSRS